MTLQDYYNSITWQTVKKQVKRHGLHKKEKKKKVRRILIPLCFLLFPFVSQAATVTIENTTIEKVSLNNKWRGGGCLAFVSSYVGSKWCAANWVSFNCDEGKDSRPLRADLAFKYALIAMDRRSLINITIDQSKIINGYCSVDELVVNKEKAVE